MAYDEEQRRVAIETFARLEHSCADTIAELGYPSPVTLRAWRRERERTGEVPARKPVSDPRHAGETGRAAVDHYLSHGRRLARTTGALGYPRSREVLCAWTGGLAPGERRRRGPSPARGPVPAEEKARTVAGPEARVGTAAEVAGRNGVSRCAPYAWRREILGHDGGDPEENAKERRGPAGKEPGGLPDDPDELRAMLREAKARPGRVQPGPDVRQATLGLPRKDPGADPALPANAEKAAMAGALRAKYRLRELLPAVGMAKSSHGYARKARARGESRARAAAREAVVAAFEDSGGTYGYRRTCARADAAGSGPSIGEWTVRCIMRQERLAARAPRRRRRHGPCEGEISAAPPNLLRDGRGRHHFRADGPNELWAADAAEFRIPARKACLSSVVDCFDGMPPGRPVTTSPDAGTDSSSLLDSCERPGEGDRPKVHSDRGCHYRWPGWIRICEEHRLVRSMPGKGCSPDNARAEGFFGRPEAGFLCECDWAGAAVEEFADMPGAHLRWYRDERARSDLGYRSPMQYRRDLGLAE